VEAWNGLLKGAFAVAQIALSQFFFDSEVVDGSQELPPIRDVKQGFKGKAWDGEWGRVCGNYAA